VRMRKASVIPVLLSSSPTPVFKGVLADAPTTREIAEFANV
jgi:hypothetical protein